MVPIMVVGDYTKAESDGLSRDDFTIGSIGIGGGIKAKISGDRWELSGRGAIAAQYAFEGFSVGTGFSPLLLADVTATFRAIPVFEGIAAGYRFRFQRWSMNDSQFDYRSMEHTVFVGVMF
jgi:hypothetical protein